MRDEDEKQIKLQQYNDNYNKTKPSQLFCFWQELLTDAQAQGPRHRIKLWTVAWCWILALMKCMYAFASSKSAIV